MKSKSIINYLFRREISLPQTSKQEVIFTENVGKAIAEEKATLPNKNQVFCLTDIDVYKMKMSGNQLINQYFNIKLD